MTGLHLVQSFLKIFQSIHTVHNRPAPPTFYEFRYNLQLVAVGIHDEELSFHAFTNPPLGLKCLGRSNNTYERATGFSNEPALRKRFATDTIKYNVRQKMFTRCRHPSSHSRLPVVDSLGSSETSDHVDIVSTANSDAAPTITRLFRQFLRQSNGKLSRVPSTESVRPGKDRFSRLERRVCRSLDDFELAFAGRGRVHADEMFAGCEAHFGYRYCCQCEDCKCSSWKNEHRHMNDCPRSSDGERWSKAALTQFPCSALTVTDGWRSWKSAVQSTKSMYPFNVPLPSISKQSKARPPLAKLQKKRKKRKKRGIIAPTFFFNPDQPLPNRPRPILLPNHPPPPAPPALLQLRNSLQHLLKLGRALGGPTEPIKMIDQHLRVCLPAVRE
ncbi:hypothetical protein KC335_g116 [Hortaea werneckii]|nr:hypothetical protein KC335_g116 [Hortaea werneckii]